MIFFSHTIDILRNIGYNGLITEGAEVCSAKMSEHVSMKDHCGKNIIDLICIARGSVLPRTSASDIAFDNGNEKAQMSPAQEAFSEITERYKNMLVSLAGAYVCDGLDFDDLYQEGLIGLYKAVMLYDPERSSFSTFVYLCMKRSIISAYKSFKKSNPEITAPLSDDFSDPEDEELYAGFVYSDNSSNPESLFIDKETTEQLFEKIDKLLSPLENKVLRSYLADKSYDDIADELKISKKSVDNALLRIRNKLKGILK